MAIYHESLLYIDTDTTLRHSLGRRKERILADAQDQNSIEKKYWSYSYTFQRGEVMLTALIS